MTQSATGASPIRLSGSSGGAANCVQFSVAFAAPADEAGQGSAPAQLVTGDGVTYDLGELAAPTAVTWREQRVFELRSHAYRQAGEFQAELRWGDVVARLLVSATAGVLRSAGLAAEAEQPVVSLFQVTPLPNEPGQRLLKLKVEGLAAGQSVRLDGGAGQTWRLSNLEGQLLAAEFLLTYNKPGRYTATLDLLDREGFWLSTLTETPIEISEPASAAEAETPAAAAAAPAEAAALSEATLAPFEIYTAEAKPWLPYRNMHVVRAANTYNYPGGGAVRRRVGTSTWLTARAETIVSGARWYQTAGGDWISASVVSFYTPSDLRGVELGVTPPPPPPPPPPPGRRGVVTATTLNVRARPGVSASNPPIASLRAGAVVDIYEEQRVSDGLWYRIGVNRWVSAAYIRVTSAAAEPVTPPPPPPVERRGIITADTLNVRGRPGVSADNPPIAVLHAGTQVTIYEEQSVAGETWYRIGDGRWVSARWVRELEATRQSAAEAEEAAPLAPTRLPLGWVVPAGLDVYARPGSAANNPAIARLGHNRLVSVEETRVVGNVRWYRISPAGSSEQWVDGRQVGVARLRGRPASIGASERWVGVNLSEQTAVAYEGDRPVFATLAATGLAGTPTVQGIFRTWQRLPTGKMSGPGYYLEDVTWTCYFYSGYALHTAYWHDAFGRPRSHGCVNLSPHAAWWIYQWSAPGGRNSPAVYVYWA